MRILQRNLKRTTDTFLFISHKPNVLLFKFRCNIFIGVRIIKEMPGSVASGTHCTFIYWTLEVTRTRCVRIIPSFNKLIYEERQTIWLTGQHTWHTFPLYPFWNLTCPLRVLIYFVFCPSYAVQWAKSVLYFELIIPRNKPVKIPAKESKKIIHKKVRNRKHLRLSEWHKGFSQNSLLSAFNPW